MCKYEGEIGNIFYLQNNTLLMMSHAYDDLCVCVHVYICVSVCHISEWLHRLHPPTASFTVMPSENK